VASRGLKIEVYFPPKRRLTFNGLHGVISQKVVLFITIAVRTSNPIYIKSSVFWDMTPCSPLEVSQEVPYLVTASCLVFNPEDGSDIFLRNIG
jgi:hypothetical protein